MRNFVEKNKKSRLLIGRKFLALLLSMVMLLSVVSSLALTMPELYAQENELNFTAGVPFTISVNTGGEERYLVLPEGLTLNNVSDFVVEEETLILNGEAELNLTAVQGNYTLQTVDSENVALGEPISFVVAAVETEVVVEEETGTAAGETEAVSEANEAAAAQADVGINAVYPPLTADEAYISSLVVTNMTDGIAPWDADSKAGNDTGATNKIVRTFDTVQYVFNAEMDTYSSTAAFSEAYVKLEFVLPWTKQEAEFDTAAMGWMATDAAHKWTVTTETRKINNKDIQCQVLTCYKYLTTAGKGVPNVVPGDFSEPVVINVKAMKNGDILQPQFSAAMEYNTWDVICSDHGTAEKKTTAPAAVTITAAPKYNAYVSLSNGGTKETLNYNTGNTTGDYPAANYGIGNVTGRLQSLNVSLMLYNDNASKGLKGIELPQGDITFDLKLSSSYNKDSGGSVDTSYDYGPLLYAYGLNGSYNDKTPDGRLLSSAAMQTPLTPEGGNWSAQQSGGTISVTVSDYVIDPDSFGSMLVPAAYDQPYVGMFSAGRFYIQQPFNEIGSANTTSNYDVIKEYGSGTFTMTVQDVNLSMTSVTGQKQTDAADTNSAQLKKDDDRDVVTILFTEESHTFGKEIYYTNATNSGVDYRDVDGKSTNVDNGMDSTLVGRNIMLASGFSYSHSSEEGEDEGYRLQYATTLTKFDASAIELTGTTYRNADTSAEEISYTVLYATRPDGKNWANDTELKNTQEDGLIYYSSLDDIPAGHLCVAILTQFSGPAKNIRSVNPRLGYSAKVKDTVAAGQVLMLTSTARAWSTNDLQSAGVTLDQVNAIDWTNSATSLSSFPANSYDQVSTNYSKESYDESGAIGTHNGGRGLGDSLLIVGYKSYVTKQMEQKEADGTIKDTFNTDSGQRVVDFVLQPRTALNGGSGGAGNVTTITVVDTLPKHLRYRLGSSYFGGTYTQISPDGGAQGLITGGTLREPDSVVTNGDGTQTLTWIIPNVTVGTTMPAIHYSANIGTLGSESTDVPALSTSSLVNEVYIYGDEDMRNRSITEGNYAEIGLSVVRGAASSFSKYTTTPVVESNGTATYGVTFGNTTSTPITKLVLMDTMPYNGDSRGSNYTGSYSLSNWKLNAGGSVSTLQLWYTTDTSYREATTETVTYEEITTGGKWKLTSLTSGVPYGLIYGPDTSNVVAWALVGTLSGGDTINVNLSLRLSGNQIGGSTLVNGLYTGNRSMTSTVTIVNRTLEGLTWMDQDEDGQQEDSEIKVSGVRATLLKLNAGGDPNDSEDYSEVDYVETGKQKNLADGTESNYETGRYKFTDVPAGTYMVRFDSEGSTSIAMYNASDVNRYSDVTDSDGIPTYDTTTEELKQTVITGIEMPKAENMNVALYESRYHDSGFYERPEFAFTKSTTTPVVESNGLAKYEVRYGNSSVTPETKLVLMDTMPYNGDSRGSSYTGSYSVSNWKLDTVSAGGSTSTLQLWYTTDTSYREATTETVTYEEITTGGKWKSTSLTLGVPYGLLYGSDSSKIVAWAMVGTLASGDAINVSLSLQLQGGQEAGSTFVNGLYTGNRSTTSKVTTANRTLEGLTWMDQDEDGQQDASEIKLSGVRVTLLKLNAGGDPNDPADYTEVEYVETGKQKNLSDGTETDYETGRYKFVNVPAGTYMVRFDSEGSTSIAPYAATGENIGSDVTDSDGIPTYDTTTGELKQTVITGITMPKAENMNVSLYESKYHDSGFYQSVNFAFTKIKGTNINSPLMGAVFEVYRSTHIHDAACGGLAADGECSFIENQKVGDIFDSSVWDTDNPVCTVTSDTDGQVSVTGLGNGVYMLVETKAPEGYTLSSGCWVLDVKSTGTTAVTIMGSSISPGGAAGAPNAFIVNKVNGEDSYFLPNYLKPKLPVSGGVGTILFVLGGITLIGAATLAYIVTGKKGKKKLLNVDGQPLQ